MTTNDRQATKATDGMMANDATGTSGSGLDRRRFLQVSGLGLGVAALAAACVNPREAEQITQTGTRIPAPSTSVAPFPGTPVLDARLALTLLALERLAVDVYDQVLKAGWLSTPAVADLARQVQGRHRARIDQVASRVTALGQDPASATPTAALRKDLVDAPLDAVKALTDKRDVEIAAAKALATMEDQLAQLYTKAAGVSTTADLRSAMAGFGSATARQYTAVAWPAGLPAAPFALQRSAPSAISEDAYLPLAQSAAPKAGATGSSGTTTTTRAS